MTDIQFENMIEKIKLYNSLACIMLRDIVEVIGTLCLTEDEWVMLKAIADNAIDRLINNQLVPRGITESDLRKMLPDNAIPKTKNSIWKEDLMKKFSKVV